MLPLPPSLSSPAPPAHLSPCHFLSVSRIELPQLSALAMYTCRLGGDHNSERSSQHPEKRWRGLCVYDLASLLIKTVHLPPCLEIPRQIKGRQELLPQRRENAAALGPCRVVPPTPSPVPTPPAWVFFILCPSRPRDFLCTRGGGRKESNQRPRASWRMAGGIDITKQHLIVGHW